MTKWSYSKEYVIEAPIAIAWKHYLDLDSTLEWEEYMTDYRPVTGEPGAQGSVVDIDFEIGKQSLTCRMTTIERSEFERVVQTAETDGQLVTSVTEVEAFGFDVTKMRCSLETDLSSVSFWKRPAQKLAAKVMLQNSMTGYIEFTEAMALKELSGALENSD